MQMRRFIQKGKKHDLVWEVWVDGADVHTRAGVLDGRLQHTFDTQGPMGKPGTKAFVSAEAQALLVAERKIRKKVEAGYIEVTKTQKEPRNSIFKALPKNLCFFKPKPQPKAGSKEEFRLNRVLEGTDAVVTIKRNGFMHPVLCTDTGEIKIYTRRMDECTDKYPKLVKEFELLQLPPKTILMCEFVCLDKNGKDDRLKIQAISNSLTKRAVALQEEDPVYAVILYIPFWEGKDTSQEKFAENFIRIIGLMEPYPSDGRLEPISIYPSKRNIESAKRVVKRVGYEGLVIYDGCSSPDEKLFNMRGKPERPDCWKWKPELEDDFLVYWEGNYGRGKLKNVAGEVSLYQHNPEGEIVFCGYCGSGFTEKERAEIVERGLADDPNGFVGVAEIKFAERSYISEGAKSNALKEPVFVRWREDKHPTECMNEKLVRE